MPRAWLALDIDDAAEVGGIDWRGAPREMRWRRSWHTTCRQSSRAFDCVASWTGSHGFKPGARYRLFLLADQRVDLAGNEGLDQANQRAAEGRRPTGIR